MSSFVYYSWYLPICWLSSAAVVNHLRFCCSLVVACCIVLGNSETVSDLNKSLFMFGAAMLVVVASQRKLPSLKGL